MVPKHEGYGQGGYGFVMGKVVTDLDSSGVFDDMTMIV